MPMVYQSQAQTYFYQNWLVVWNIFYFPIYWEESSQLTFIFFRGVQTTNQKRMLLSISRLYLFNAEQNQQLRRPTLWWFVALCERKNSMTIFGNAKNHGTIHRQWFPWQSVRLEEGKLYSSHQGLSSSYFTALLASCVVYIYIYTYHYTPIMLHPYILFVLKSRSLRDKSYVVIQKLHLLTANHHVLCEKIPSNHHAVLLKSQ